MAARLLAAALALALTALLLDTHVAMRIRLRREPLEEPSEEPSGEPSEEGAGVPSLDFLWTSKDLLPSSEGTTFEEFNSSLTTIEECMAWCEKAFCCIGFSAWIISNNFVNQWHPKMCRTGFDPERVTWGHKHESFQHWQFHWKTDAASLEENNDGTSLMIPCPFGLSTRPGHDYQCIRRSGDDVVFNKDGGMDVGALVAQQLDNEWASVLDAYQHVLNHSHDEHGEHHHNGLEVVAHFAVEHGVEDAVIHSLAKGFHVLSHSLAHGGSMNVGSAAAHIVGGFLHAWSSLAPIMLPLAATTSIAQRMYEWTLREIAGLDKIQALMYKASCMRYLIQQSTSSGLELTSVVTEQCGDSIASAIKDRISQAADSLDGMFLKIEEISRCLTPAAGSDEPAWRKRAVQCIENTFPNLRQTNQKMGVLMGALLVASVWGQMTDPLLETNSKFSMHNNVKTYWSLRDLPEVGSSVENLQNMSEADRTVTCMSYVTSQQAYEKVFNKLTEALELWMRTFALDDSSSFFASPCKDVFNNLLDSSLPLCKHELFTDSLGFSCGKAAADRLWQL